MADPIRAELERLAAGDILARLEALEAAVQQKDQKKPPKGKE